VEDAPGEAGEVSRAQPPATRATTMPTPKRSSRRPAWRARVTTERVVKPSCSPRRPLPCQDRLHRRVGSARDVRNHIKP